MESLLVHILGACEGAVIAFRQKALKALASIVEQDPPIFLQDNVRQAVEKRLLDSSPAVRDAALEMLGRYVVYRPELAKQYLPKIAERINVCCIFNGYTCADLHCYRIRVSV
jgi:cohesin loading factor subunit SCC2